MTFQTARHFMEWSPEPQYEKDAMAAYTRGNGSDEDSVTGFRFGMTHKF